MSKAKPGDFDEEYVCDVEGRDLLQKFNYMHLKFALPEIEDTFQLFEAERALQIKPVQVVSARKPQNINGVRSFQQSWLVRQKIGKITSFFSGANFVEFSLNCFEK